MIGKVFAKPLQPDTLTRSVKKKVEREAERVEAVPVRRDVTRTVLEPVFREGQGGARVVERYEERRKTETVTELRWRTVKALVTDEVDVPEEFENPAPNTLGRYREAAEWADAHGPPCWNASPAPCSRRDIMRCAPCPNRARKSVPPQNWPAPRANAHGPWPRSP